MYDRHVIGIAYYGPKQTRASRNARNGVARKNGSLTRKIHIADFIRSVLPNAVLK